METHIFLTQIKKLFSTPIMDLKKSHEDIIMELFSAYLEKNKLNLTIENQDIIIKKFLDEETLPNKAIDSIEETNKQIEYLSDLKKIQNSELIKSLLNNVRNKKTSDKQKHKNSKKEKIISYNIIENLEGYIASNGKYGWCDDKIDDFLTTLMNKKI